MNVCKLGLSIAMLLSGGMAFAQGTVDDYNRAYALREKFSANKVFYSSVTPQWIEGHISSGMYAIRPKAVSTYR